MFSDNEKFKMNKAAKAIVKGQVVCALVVGSFLGVIAAPAKAQEARVSSELMDKNQAEWSKLVRQFNAKSIKQTGKSTFVHFCEPKFKVCTEMVTYKIKGRTMYVAAVKDEHEVVFERQVCNVNKTEDVRHCVNFDTKTKHTDMKDESGQWHLVSGVE